MSTAHPLTPGEEAAIRQLVEHAHGGLDGWADAYRTAVSGLLATVDELRTQLAPGLVSARMAFPRAPEISPDLPILRSSYPGSEVIGRVWCVVADGDRQVVHATLRGGPSNGVHLSCDAHGRVVYLHLDP